MSASLSRRLAKFAHDVTFADLPSEVVDKVKALTLQALVSALAGHEHSDAQRIVEFIKREEGATAGSTILVDGSRVTKAGAAYANSELIHRGGRLDIYKMLTHPGTTIMPAALVAAEAEDRSGEEFVAAVAVAYEVQARLAGERIQLTQARGFRSSPIFGIFGAAIAASKLMGLSEDEISSAIALCVDLASGNLEGARTGSHSISVHEPSAARNALLAVLLAREGMRGSETALDGAAGFYHAYTGRAMLHPEAAIKTLGRQWEIMNTALRIYAIAGTNLALIDVTAKLCTDASIRPQDVDSVEVVVNWLETTYPSPAFPRSQVRGPQIGSAAYYCAYGIVERGFPMSRSRADPQSSSSPDEPPGVIAMMKRIRITPSKTRPQLAPTITIRTNDGKRHRIASTGREFMFDLREEIDRVRPLDRSLPIRPAQFAKVVAAVTKLEELDKASRLIDLTMVSPQASAKAG